MIPFVDRLLKVSLREIVMDVPPQDVITRDNDPFMLDPSQHPVLAACRAVPWLPRESS